jgi:lysyl-tRNA synthetase, class I
VFWADEIAASVSGPQLVNDSKTPSGTIHVGALRGVVIHDAIVRAVRDSGSEARFLYGIDDLDPMDSATLATQEGVGEYMGRPLAEVPAPRGSQQPTWARHFAQTFLDTFHRLGVYPDLYWASEQYRAGIYDDFIREALDRAAEVLRIYREVANVRHPDDWHPVMAICANCGRIGTTYVDGWDGNQISYRCLPELVEWAAGCGHRGRISPFGGNAKLPWNLHWVAKWKVLGVTIEAAGKDLSTAGGSRERAEALAREVFGFEPPVSLKYEFLLTGGRKMKSSAGTGPAAHDIVEILPPELVRFLMLRYRPQATIEFDPAGETIPRLFDEYDSYVAEAVAGPVEESDPHEAAHRRRIVEMAQVVGGEPPRHFLAPFVQVATYAQMPGATLARIAEQIARHRGASLSDPEMETLAVRLETVRRWLPELAPERLRFSVALDELPPAVGSLSGEQRDYLLALSERLSSTEEWGAEALQAEVFALATERKIPAGHAFRAIYAALLGKPHGPRAGSLLASLDRSFVIDRLRSAVKREASLP